MADYKLSFTAEEIDRKLEKVDNISWNDLTDKPFYEEGDMVEVVPETTELQVVNKAKMLVEGETYIVTWDGVEYRRNAFTIPSIEAWVCLGNFKEAGATDTGEPFAIYECEDTDFPGTYVIRAASGHTWSIDRVATIIHPIEGKYLPKDVVFVDVLELPTENIDEHRFYRIPEGMFVSEQGVVGGKCYYVAGLPSTGEPVTADGQSVNAGYYNTLDGDVYGYLPEPIASTAGVPVGWYPFSALAPVFGITWFGVIEDILDCPMDVEGVSLGVLIESDVWYYKHGWMPVNPVGWHGEGNFAEAFNHSANVASGNYAHAEGRKTIASGYCSHAEGQDTQAISYRCHAEGCDTIASGCDAHAEGYNTTASGDFAHAEGQGTVASGQESHAEGRITTAEGAYSHAEGCFTTASGIYSHTEGLETTASGSASHAEGRGTIASRDNQHVQGRYNINNTTFAHIVGNGEGEKARSNAHTLDWEGNAWFAGDVYTGSTSGTNKDEGSKKLATEEYADNAAEVAAAAVKDDLLNGAGEAYDTLKELGDLIDENHDAIDALEIVATGKADKVHNHDDLYYTKSQLDNLELITVADIDAICGTTIQVVVDASSSEVTF